MRLTTLFFAFIAMSVPAIAFEDENTPDMNKLPNDCGILAQQAQHRLAQTGVWTALIRVNIANVGGHVFVCWQGIDGRLCIYDRNGTFYLPPGTKKQLKSIVEAVGKVWGEKGLSPVEMILPK